MRAAGASSVTGRTILALAVPALGTLAADPLLSLVDTAFVGRLGGTALAALGIDTAIFSFAFAVFNFLAYATTPLVASASARGDREEVGRIAGRAITLALVIGASSLTVLVLAARPLVEAFGAGPQVVGEAITYLRVRALAVPALLIITAGHGVFRGLQDTKTPLYLTIAANAINALLDPLLIFGLGLGIAGAAWATVAAQTLAGALFVVLIARRGRATGFGIRLVGLRDAAKLLRFGGVLVLRTLLLVATLAAATSTAARIGVVAVAAHQVVAQLWFLLAMMVDALAIAAQAIVGDLVGRNDARGIVDVWRRLVVWGIVVGSVLGGLLWLLGPRLAPVFTDDPDIVDAIGSVIPIAAVMQPIAGALFVADGLYMGLLALRRLVLSTASGFVAAVLVFVWTLSSDAPLAGVWWGIAVMVSVRAVVLLTRPPVRRLGIGSMSQAAAW